MAARYRSGDGDEQYSGVDVVHGCFTEGGDSVLSVFSSEPMRAKL